MDKSKSKRLIGLALLGIFLIFIYFGTFHIAKFETVDERLWKYGRIKNYWQAWKDGNWKKTYINDKPGVTLAVVSGAGLFFTPDPEKHQITDDEETKNGKLVKYDTSQSEKINLSFRLPILIFVSLFIPIFYWFVKKAFESWKIALLSTFITFTSPIIIGIAQIINPDALLWLFFSLAIFSHISLLKHREKKFLIFAGLFTGLSILSKYSSNILFPFYFLLIFLYFFFNFEKVREKIGIKKYFSSEFLNLLIIFLISVFLYSLFIPAVFVKPEYLYNGTIGFYGFKMIIGPMLLVSLLVVLDIVFFKSKWLSFLGDFFVKNKKWIMRIAVSLVLLIFIFNLLNCWLGQKVILYDELRAKIYSHGKGGFALSMKKHSLPEAFLLQTYPFTFSLPAILFVMFIFFGIKNIFSKKEGKNDLYLLFFCLAFMAYFFAAVLAKVMTNIRYSMMIYPLFYVLAGIAVFDLLEFLKEKRIRIAVIIFLVISSITTLFLVRPHYFVFTNSLLPKKYIITDSWGYGDYEAAQVLNSFPHAEDLLVWTNRRGFCQFFEGRCIQNRKRGVDAMSVKPDYFVISARGELKNKFHWENPELAKRDGDYYYEKLKNDYDWAIFVGDRPSNFVKILKSEE